VSNTIAITGSIAASGGGIWIDASNPLNSTGSDAPAISGNTPADCQDISGACA
jgi:hypothetical protein